MDLQKQLEEVFFQTEDLKFKKKMALHRVIEGYLEGQIDPSIYIEVYDSMSVEFYAKDETGYERNIVRISIKEDYKTGEIRALEAGYSSGGGNDQFNLKRMLVIGAVGLVLMDFGDDILAEFNRVFAEYQPLLSKLLKERFDLERKIKEQKLLEELQQVNQLVVVASNEGICFSGKTSLEDRKYSDYPKVENTDLPVMQVKFDQAAANVASFKILNTTPSGKSADIAIKKWKFENVTLEGAKHPTWLPTSVLEEEIFTKVRMSNIEHFLKQYSSRASKGVFPTWELPSKEEVEAAFSKVDQTA